MSAYYNEHDLFAAQWLRNLIAAGHIAPGEVDTRSIEDVTSDDLRGYQQCHFFAGIGVWSRALRNAGWPDDRVVWTGSCPCQPFSAAGKGAGFTDERHLWPAWHHLIEECHPPVVLGEQVASALAWLDLVSADMEAAGYAFGASDLCAAGFGGAHIRQRLYFVGVGDALSAGRPKGRAEPGSRPAADTGAAGGLADSPGERRAGLDTLLRPEDGRRDAPQEVPEAAGRSHLVGLADTMRGRAGDDAGEGMGAQAAPDQIDRGVPGQRLRTGVEDSSGGLALSNGGNPGPERQQRSGEQRQHSQDGSASGLADNNNNNKGPQGRPGVSERGDELPVGQGGVEAEPRPAHAPLLGRHAVDWLYCRDAKWRPVEPGTFPLADAAPARVGRLRAYGNGLDLETATGFVGAVMDALGSP